MPSHTFASQLDMEVQSVIYEGVGHQCCLEEILDLVNWIRDRFTFLPPPPENACTPKFAGNQVTALASRALFSYALCPDNISFLCAGRISGHICPSITSFISECCVPPSFYPVRASRHHDRPSTPVDTCSPSHQISVWFPSLKSQFSTSTAISSPLASFSNGCCVPIPVSNSSRADGGDDYGKARPIVPIHQE